MQELRLSNPAAPPDAPTGPVAAGPAPERRPGADLAANLARLLRVTAAQWQLSGPQSTPSLVRVTRRSLQLVRLHRSGVGTLDQRPVLRQPVMRLQALARFAC